MPDLQKKEANVNLNDYQQTAHETAVYGGVIEMIAERIRMDGSDQIAIEFLSLAYCALGLAGEAGEFSNKVKKALHDHEGKLDPEIIEDLLDELGDAQWYLAEAASRLNALLSTVAEMNLAKLQARRTHGRISGSGDQR